MQSSVKLHRPDSFAGVARRILQAQLVLMEASAARAVRFQSISAVHDLRVAIRRFCAALRVFGERMPGEGVKRLRKRLQEMNRQLGPVRDAQVWCSLVRRFVSKQNGLLSAEYEQCVKAAEANCAARVQQLGRIVKGAPFREAHECCNGLLSNNPSGSSRKQIQDQAAAFLAGKLLRAYKHLCRIEDPLVGATGEEEHAFRRRCRRVRYLSEFTEPMMGRLVQKLSRRLKRASNLLGDRHDAEVQVGQLAALTETPKELLRRVTCRRHEAQQEFNETWEKLTASHFRKRILMELRAAKKRGL